MLILSTQAKMDWMLSLGFRELFDSGYLWLYDGVRPESPDLDVSGNLIAVVTKDGLYPNFHSNELLRNALYFDFDAPSGILHGTTEDLFGDPIWKIHVVSEGTPTWFRFTRLTNLPTGHNSARVRMDGTIGDDLILLNPTLTLNSTVVINVFRVYL